MLDWVSEAATMPSAVVLRGGILRPKQCPTDLNTSKNRILLCRGWFMRWIKTYFAQASAMKLCVSIEDQQTTKSLSQHSPINDQTPRLQGS